MKLEINVPIDEIMKTIKPLVEELENTLKEAKQIRDELMSERGGDYLTSKETAKFLGISYSSFMSNEKYKNMPVKKIENGNKILWNKKDLTLFRDSLRKVA